MGKEGEGTRRGRRGKDEEGEEEMRREEEEEIFGNLEMRFKVFSTINVVWEY